MVILSVVCWPWYWARRGVSVMVLCLVRWYAWSVSIKGTGDEGTVWVQSHAVVLCRGHEGVQWFVRSMLATVLYFTGQQFRLFT